MPGSSVAAFRVPFSLPLSSNQARNHHIRRTPICAAQPPRRIGAVAKDVQSALQSALRSRLSRLSVTLPEGARLGTEKRSEDLDAISARVVGDRELCRILSAMFEGTGLSVRAIFPTPGAARAAKKAFGPLTECDIQDWESMQKPQKSTGSKKAGFGKSSDEKPETANVDVFLLVNPKPGQMMRLQRLAEEFGMDKLVILVNCDVNGTKVPKHLTEYLQKEFEDVYFYKPNPHPQWSGGVLFRKYPDDWVLCRQPPVGFLKQVLVKDSRPDLDEMAAALREEEKDPATGLLNKLSSFLGTE